MVAGSDTLGSPRYGARSKGWCSAWSDPVSVRKVPLAHSRTTAIGRCWTGGDIAALPRPDCTTKAAARSLFALTPASCPSDQSVLVPGRTVPNVPRSFRRVSLRSAARPGTVHPDRRASAFWHTCPGWIVPGWVASRTRMGGPAGQCIGRTEGERIRGAMGRSTAIENNIGAGEITFTYALAGSQRECTFTAGADG